MPASHVHCVIAWCAATVPVRGFVPRDMLTTCACCETHLRADVECTKDICNEEMVKSQADAIVSEGLKGLGWTHVTLDDCWGGQRLANGSYSWDPLRFPSGNAKPPPPL